MPFDLLMLGNLKDWLPGGSNSKNDEGKKQKLETIIEEDEEEVGGEEEGNTMVRIDTESRTGVAGDDVFGPLAVLMIGFLEEDVAAFRKLMVEMEADMVKLIPCTKAMLSGTLQQALEAEVPPYQQPPLGTRRALVLSGMYGSEVVEVVTAYKESGLPPAVFAAAVPRNYSRVVKELLSEVYADHMAMQQRVAQQRLAAEAADNSDEAEQVVAAEQKLPTTGMTAEGVVAAEQKLPTSVMTAEGVVAADEQKLQQQA
eukprot:CAMPEP_0202903320 /NCGR_PEP_ID=MMETSP1392-20130828/23881_1 /ASSEMBLY_ACC=CAM_ASM_000868 /TAXON_ID=225041 /ORGANISM="Chlamydomonas chlamydogama, Strain SAG 11-48b" /LENGTH=256 /DNA_ID=CAMNT_0049590443 /DNA_START=161 /DNA_END=933 /DNA_ORIENTATION=-